LTQTLNEIAELVGGSVSGDGEFRISGIRPLEDATEEEISLYMDPRYEPLLRDTRAGALIVARQTPLFTGPQLVADHPGLAYAKTAKLFAPEPAGFKGIHPRAHIDESSRIGRDVTIFPLAYVGANSVIEAGVTIYPGVFIGDRVRIGEGSIVHPNVSILHDCTLGRSVIVHAGSVIGSDGFGFIRVKEKHVKIPQIGKVEIEDNVEIGAGNTIDRGALGTTRIGKGVKTDNMVHIAHNVVVGENTLLVAQAAISGSAEIGRDVIVGGQVGIGDHVKVGDGTMIGPQSGVAKSLGPGEVVAGTPTMAHRLWLKTSLLLTRLPGLNERVRMLEKKVDKLTRRLDP
jgi:UDP-3-O-[3-hydroxymyristoyl] glucosamine N-acyltransferase